MQYIFIIVISSHSHIKWKQPQRTFLQYSCSVTIINIVKKYLWRKIHKLNTLIRSSNDSQPEPPNKYIVKNPLLENKYWWLLLFFHQVLLVKLLFFFSESSPVPHLLSHTFTQNPFYGRVFWQSKLEKNHQSDFLLHQFLSRNTCTFRSCFVQTSKIIKFNKWSCPKKRARYKVKSYIYQVNQSLHEKHHKRWHQ